MGAPIVLAARVVVLRMVLIQARIYPVYDVDEPPLWVNHGRQRLGSIRDAGV
jgi:hypothetical protein